MSVTRQAARQAVCIAAILINAVGSPAPADEAAESLFRGTIEPILRQRCYGCHSHQAGVMEGDLALDWRSGWQIGGSRGSAIVPGDPEASLLIQAVRHASDDLAMPEDRLPDDEIQVLVAWVLGGAIDPRVSEPSVAPAVTTDWWSLAALELPHVPSVPAAEETSQPVNPIDAFVGARLAAEGLGFSDEADRRTLIRRLSIDLHGLPPSPADVDAFLADRQPNAVERVVDRLLASPRYGERWARHWLDTIHFADSHGFEHDIFRPNAWRYRDYVIQSLNDDVAWDRFIREQLAADFFFPKDSDRIVALGYLGAGPYDHSAASTAPRNFENLDRDDLVTQTMAAFASTTASCARCHAHKFDPISQADYYSLQAVFAGIGKGDVAFDANPAVAAERDRWEQLSAAAVSRDPDVLLSESNQQLVARWEAEAGSRSLWQPLSLGVATSGHGAELSQQPDGSLLCGGTRPDVESTTIVAATSLRTVTAIRLDMLTDPSLPMHGPGRADNGNLHLSEISLRAVTPDLPAGLPVAIATATASFDQEGWTIAHAIDGDRKTAWGIHPAVGQPHQAVFSLAEPLEITAGMQLAIQLEQVHGRGHVIGRFSLSATDADPSSAIVLPVEARAALVKPPASRQPHEQLALASAVLGQIAARELASLPQQSMVYAAAAVAKNERGTIRYEQPRPIHVLKRGNIEAAAEEVAAGALSSLAGLEHHFDLPDGHVESVRRAALAAWLADRANPLTWRSIVNRVWHFHFGAGICDTPNDFGRMGSQPTHPHLLDWLACTFRDSGGSLKDLHRLICTSRTYRQTSTVSATAAQRDPENRLLSRFNRRRLDADCLRDAILQVSGQLDLTMGGPGDQHFSQTPGPQLTPVLDYSDVDWAASGMQRRSIYRVVWRGIPDPFFEAFDFPNLGLLVAKRGESVSPLQSLALRNNRFVLHHAQAMAREIGSRDSRLSLHEQVNEAVRRAWLREPTPDEAAGLVDLANTHGLEAACRLLLNSNEFLFVD